MVLLNIEQLTDSELRYIAQQENLKNWEILSRQDLIEELEEFYDDDDSSVTSENARKFVKSLTQVDSSIDQLPGVEPLPKTFNSTFIQCIQIDSNWAYVNWGISKLQLSKLENNSFTVILQVLVMDKQQITEDSYEIVVSDKDDSWNIELPWSDRTYKIKLIARTSENDEVLAVSNSIYRPGVFFEKNPQLLRNPDRKKILFQSLIANDGQLISNRLVHELYAKAQEKIAL